MKILCLPVNELSYFDTAVIELAVTGNGFAVNCFGGDDLGDLGQTGEDTFTVKVSQASFDVILGI